MGMSEFYGTADEGEAIARWIVAIASPSSAVP